MVSILETERGAGRLWPAVEEALDCAAGAVARSGELPAEVAVELSLALGRVVELRQHSDGARINAATLIDQADAERIPGGGQLAVAACALIRAHEVVSWMVDARQRRSLEPLAREIYEVAFALNRELGGHVAHAVALAEGGAA